jgi:cytochrome b6-f complex iron-sulfur subunit
MQTPAERPTRRSLLDVLLGVGALGFLSSVVYPVLRYLKPLAPQEGSGALRLTREEIVRLEKEHSLILRHGPTRVLLFEDPEQRLRALEARCTHEGCTVQYVPGDSVIWCACHNGRFDLDGRVLAGPPPRPLARWLAQREPDGNVSVAKAPPEGSA